MKKPAGSKRTKKPVKVTVRVLRQSALKAFETNCLTTVTNVSK